MRAPRKREVILLAEDNEGDFILVKEAWEEAHVDHDLRRVSDGEQLMAYLQRGTTFEDPVKYPAPTLVLLDLNMPRKNGREAMREIRMDSRLKHLPVVVLTTSNAPEDVIQCYQLGANSFVRKPETFAGLVDAIKVLSRYWLEVAELPPEPWRVAGSAPRDVQASSSRGAPAGLVPEMSERLEGRNTDSNDTDR